MKLALAPLFDSPTPGEIFLSIPARSCSEVISPSHHNMSGNTDSFIPQAPINTDLWLEFARCSICSDSENIGIK